jgi:restriction system protein
VVPADLLGAPERAKSFIADMINRLDWDELQDLVAGVLRAMGYKTRVSTPGPDRGVDIFASPDGLGLQEPRIFVEVKHRQAAMGAPDLRTFLGGRKAGEKCLYVSTGGFKKDAHYEADRSTIPITLVTLPVLRDLLLDHYDLLDEETRALVPLRRVYLPFDPND